MNVEGAGRSIVSDESPRESLPRELAMVACASVVAIAICILLAVLGVPLNELDRWTLILSVPWFAALYLLSRQSEPVMRTLSKAKLTTARAAAAVAAIALYIPQFVFEGVKQMLVKLHLW